MGTIKASYNHVNSSNIKEITFISKEVSEDGIDELLIKFHGDSVYRYKYVPQSLFLQLIGSVSVGKFFSVFIKNKEQYPCEKLVE